MRISDWSSDVCSADLLSAPLLEVAQRRNAGHQGLRFVQGDAQVFPFAPASFDAAFSRFGVMFFADPVAAFLNSRRGLKPGGRLAFACWRSLEENPTYTLPMQDRKSKRLNSSH